MHDKSWQERERRIKEIQHWHKTLWKAKITMYRLEGRIDEVTAQGLIDLSPYDAWKLNNSYRGYIGQIKNDDFEVYKKDWRQWLNP